MGSVRQVFVHIGPYKSGTTYLQNILWGNEALLAEAGVRLPRNDWRGQRRAVAALLRRDPADRGGGADRWDALAREVADVEDAEVAVLSVERLCEADPAAVGALVSSLAPATVDVIYTARSLARAVPGDWQTRIRNRSAPTWAAYLASVRDPGDAESHGGRFWRQQDPAQSLPPWLEHVPVERVHVVTVPPPGSAPELLWRRFCVVLGLQPDGYDLAVPRANVSLGGVEAEALRRLTARVADRLPLRAYVDVVNHFVARDVLERREQSFRLVLPAGELDWLQPRSAAVVDFLRTGGFPVVGDLADLVPRPEPSERAPDEVHPAEVAAVLADVLAETAMELGRRQQPAR